MPFPIVVGSKFQYFTIKKTKTLFAEENHIKLRYLYIFLDNKDTQIQLMAENYTTPLSFTPAQLQDLDLGDLPINNNFVMKLYDDINNRYIVFLQGDELWLKNMSITLVPPAGTAVTVAFEMMYEYGGEY